MNDLEQVAEALNASVKALGESVNRQVEATQDQVAAVSKRSRRQAWVSGFLVLVVLVMILVIRDNRRTAQTAEEALAQLQADRLEAREARCDLDDEENADTRRAIVDGGLITGIASGDALIKTVTEAGRPPDQALTDAYRKNLEGIRPHLEGLANTFPSYEWDPKTESCVEIPMDTDAG